MSPRRSLAVVAAALTLPVAAAGCGFGPGESSDGAAQLRVTRDYGGEVMVEATWPDPSETDTVMRALDGEAALETRFGGGFVHSIDGVEGTLEDGRSLDWFFYVNGVESSVGAAEVALRPGDRVWWDYRDWTDVMRVPAVVGSWPEPFAQESAEAPVPIVLECDAERSICDEAAERLAGEEAELGQDRGGDGSPDQAPRMLVGEWDAVRDDDAASLLSAGPQASGVFARFERERGAWSLRALDLRAEEATTLGPGSGLVAAVREGEDPPVWLVTGTDEAGVEAAARSLDEATLRDRYAVATDGSEPIALPVAEAG